MIDDIKIKDFLFLLKELSQQLTTDFGKGFTVADLKDMRQFYVLFPNSYALRSKLSWLHYRLIIWVENRKQKRFKSECTKFIIQLLNTENEY